MAFERQQHGRREVHSELVGGPTKRLSYWGCCTGRNWPREGKIRAEPGVGRAVRVVGVWWRRFLKHARADGCQKKSRQARRLGSTPLVSDRSDEEIELLHVRHGQELKPQKKGERPPIRIFFSVLCTKLGLLPLVSSATRAKIHKKTTGQAQRESGVR